MTTTYPKNVDIVLHAGEWATVWSFQPITDNAKQWVDENLELEGWQWAGDCFCVDHREARRLAEFLCEEGFILYHPTYGFHRSNRAA